MGKRPSTGSAQPSAKKGKTVAPLLEDENSSITSGLSPVGLSVLPKYFAGASYNAELHATAASALQELLKDIWPGIESEDALPLGHGARQATRLNAS